MDKIHSLSMDLIMGVANLFFPLVFGQVEFCLVFPQEIRVVKVGMNMVKIAEKFVKPLPVGMAGVIFESKTPFSKCARDIPGLLENFRDRHIRVQKVLPTMPSADRRMAGVQSCYQRTAGRGAAVRARVSLSKFHALRGKTVDVRGLDLLLSVTTKFTVTEIVSEDKDDVGRTR